MSDLEPFYLADLFPRLDAMLIELLGGLSGEEWGMPTICSLWSVKDIAAHLLDGNIRRLSMIRDDYMGAPAEGIDSYGALVDYLNRLNAEWVTAARRISPRVLTDLLEQTGREVADLFSALDPHAPALFTVAWAGEDVSENWFDIAREYTERWLHQQQIRLAVNRPGIEGRELYHPVLRAFMRALPHTYRHVDAPAGALLRVVVPGDAGGMWMLGRIEGSWKMVAEGAGPCTATVSIPPEIAWRLFTKGIGREEGRAAIIIEGDEKLGAEILNMLAVMA